MAPRPTLEPNQRADSLDGRAALAPGEGMPRNAGQSATRDGPDDDWTLADEAGDESFPASDPPGLSIADPTTDLPTEA